jgi:hypothetical protein
VSSSPTENDRTFIAARDQQLREQATRGPSYSMTDAARWSKNWISSSLSFSSNRVFFFDE